MRNLWKKLVEDPNVFKTINGWLTIFWIAMIPISVFMGWVNSVPYVSALSIYALITGHLSTWQAARVEAIQEADNTEQVVEEVRTILEESDQV